MEYSETALDEAAAAYRRIENFVERAVDDPSAAPRRRTVPSARTSQPRWTMTWACRWRWPWCTRPSALATPRWPPGDRTAASGALAAVLTMTGLLGLDPREWRADSADDLRPTLDSLVHVALEQRAAARGRKDFAAADAIRAQLAAAGVIVEDTPSGPRWTLDARTGH